MSSMKFPNAERNFIVCTEQFDSNEIWHQFHSVSKQEIESLCTMFRHLTKGGDKGTRA